MKRQGQTVLSAIVDNHTHLVIKQFVPAFLFVKYYYNELT